MSQKIIGIDLGGTSVQVCYFNARRRNPRKWSIKTNILDEEEAIL